MSRRFLFGRVGSSILTIYVAITVNFLLFRIAPGDPLAQFERIPGITPRELHGLRERFGLDQPLMTQYGRYLDQLVHGDLGRSFANGSVVSTYLLGSLKNTVLMVSVGVVFGAVVGTVIGVLAASHRGKPADHLGVSTSLLLYSFPSQWLALMLIFLFTGILPSGGRVNDFALNEPFFTHVADVGEHLILPALTLGLVLCGQYALVARSATLDALSEDFILTARAKGVRRSRILWRHAFRNAMLPQLTLFALSLSSIVSGSILIETVFSWPGVGRAIYQAIFARDWPVLQGAFLLITVTVVVLNLLADLAYGLLDPRVRA